MHGFLFLYLLLQSIDGEHDFSCAWLISTRQSRVTMHRIRLLLHLSSDVAALPCKGTCICLTFGEDVWLQDLLCLLHTASMYTEMARCLLQTPELTWTHLASLWHQHHCRYCITNNANVLLQCGGSLSQRLQQFCSTLLSLLIILSNLQLAICHQEYSYTEHA